MHLVGFREVGISACIDVGLKSCCSVILDLRFTPTIEEINLLLCVAGVDGQTIIFLKACSSSRRRCKANLETVLRSGSVKAGI